MIIVLDNIRSALNVGSVFRTSDAFAVEKLILCGITATPPSREIHKTALGAEQSVPFEYCKSTCEALDLLHDNGYTIVAIEQSARSVLLHNFEPKENTKYAYVLGNEVQGVSPEALAMCDYVVEIPQRGVKKSLNVSVAAGIVMWQVEYNNLKK